MDYYDDLMELCDTVSKHIGEANDKIRESDGKLTGSDVDYIDKLAHTLKSVMTIIAMMDADNGYSSDDGYEGGSYNGNMGNGGSYNRGSNNNGGSYARGRGRNAKRDSMGRYSSNGGYSRHGEVSEEIKKDIQRLADKVEQM